jgi:hypothetical protein
MKQRSNVRTILPGKNLNQMNSSCVLDSFLAAGTGGEGAEGAEAEPNPNLEGNLLSMSSRIWTRVQLNE